jgi:hypothetical protein
MLFSEENHMKTHKINEFRLCYILPNTSLELHTEDKPWLLRAALLR